MKYAHFCLLVGCIMFAACTERVPQEKTAAKPEIFPDYTEVTVPRTIAPLNFRVEGATHIQAIAKDCNSETYVKASGKEHVEFNLKDWHALLAQADSVCVSVAVWDEAHPEGIQYGDFKFYINNDEIDPWLMYRLIPPGYEGWNKMGIYQRNLSSFEQRTVVSNEENGRGCLNCHAVCQGNPDKFTFHSRGENGGTIIQCNGNMENVNLKAIGAQMQGSYNFWHPSGKYIAFANTNTHQTFMARSKDKIEAYDLWGSLFIYDVEKHDSYVDERFNDSTTLESFPAFSPDGKWLYFVSAKRVNMPKEYEILRYNILRLSFDESNGRLGENIDTIYNAEKRERSAIIPRISPNGRYLMYSTSPSGALTLYHNDSDLGMIDLETMTDVDCTCLNSEESESYHSWSSNGKWVLFSSKRIDGRFTRLYFTHWDGKTWTKPFMLPQEDPYDNTLLMMAYNVPDFILKPVQIDRSRVKKLLKRKEE